MATVSRFGCAQGDEQGSLIANRSVSGLQLPAGRSPRHLRRAWTETGRCSSSTEPVAPVPLLFDPTPRQTRYPPRQRIASYPTMRPWPTGAARCAPQGHAPGTATVEHCRDTDDRRLGAAQRPVQMPGDPQPVLVTTNPVIEGAQAKPPTHRRTRPVERLCWPVGRCSRASGSRQDTCAGVSAPRRGDRGRRAGVRDIGVSQQTGGICSQRAVNRGDPTIRRGPVA